MKHINIEKIEGLYLLAEDNNIPIDEDCPESIISMSVKLKDGSKVICISDKPSNTAHTRLERFAHEMGHCMTDSFYAGYSPFELRAKHERRADEWAVDKLVPFSELCKAIKNGYREPWELAEYFDVSCRFIEKAVMIHEQNGLIVPRELYEEF